MLKSNRYQYHCLYTEKCIYFDPKIVKKVQFLTQFGPVLDPGPTHGSGSDFGPGYPVPRPGSGRSNFASTYNN